MAKFYYLKENISNVFNDRNGRPFPFQSLAQEYGVLELEDADPAQKEIMQDLEALRAQRIGGILRISQAEYESKKKNMPWRPSASRSDLLEMAPPRFNPVPPRGAAVAAAPVSQQPIIPPQPVPPTPQPHANGEPPKPAFKPRTARPKKAEIKT